MKNLTKYLAIVQAALVSLALAGCSSVHATREPTVRDVVGEVIKDDNVAKEPSLVLVGYSTVNSSVRSNSVWTSRKIVKEPDVQGVQGRALQAIDGPGTKSRYEPQLSGRVTRRREGLNVTSQRHRTVLVGDALKEVFGGSNTTKESNVRNVVAEVIAAVEMSVEDDGAEEPSTK